jgi:DNA mismatch endonuclease (patch repair protein)
MSKEQRSALMSRIHGKNTLPELVVRRLCRELGLTGYRLHRKDLPGSPDIAWIGKKVAIFVNGCYWHAHNCKKGSYPINTNSDFWKDKFRRNRQRDAGKIKALRANGWRVGLIWECELNNRENVSRKIAQLMTISK